MNDQKKDSKVVKTEKDTPIRSIAKAISWRIIATLTTFLIVTVIFSANTDNNLYEILGFASYVAAIEVVAKLVFYYIHERIWTNVKWGRYWQRHYWKSRAWRKMYNKMHEAKSVNN